MYESFPVRATSLGEYTTEQLPSPVAATLEVPAPGFTGGLQDDSAVIMDLPSRYAFYDFKDLYAVPFKGVHMRKLFAARQTQSQLHVVEAVSTVLSNTAGDTKLAFKLTMPDFYFIMHWLRMESFTKSAFIHNSVCRNPEHIKEVQSGRVAQDTLTHSQVINKSTLKTKMLERVPNPEAYPLSIRNLTLGELRVQNLALGPATMADTLEVSEHPDVMDSEFQYAASKAVYLKADRDSNTGRELTFSDKLKIVDELSPDDHLIISAYEKVATDYGVDETVQVTCKHCGHSRIDKIFIGAASFFQ